jgi:hypothetical protein
MLSLKQIEIVVALTEMKSLEIAELVMHLASVDPLTAQVLRNALTVEIGAME